MNATQSLMPRPSPSGVMTRPRTRTISSRPRLGPPHCVPAEVFLVLGEVGDVEAPTGTIFIAAAIATVAVLLIPFGLKGGTDAANEMQDRDAKSGRWRK